MAVSLTIVSTAGLVALVGMALLVLLRRLSPSGEKAALPENWEQLYVSSRYKPMERLLDAEDFRLLNACSTHGRRMARRLRANRIGIFRGYARRLAKDFSRVSAALRTLMVHAEVDRSALAGLLLKQRLLFKLNMTSLELRLVLYSLGLTGTPVQVRGLVEALDAMGEQLRALAVTLQPAASAA